MPNDALELLTPGEEFELQGCEDTIKAHIGAFWEVLFAFTKIQEMRLWRRDYKSFKEYCEQRWGVTAARIRQLTRAYEIKSSLTPEFAALITNEWQARELAKVPTGQRNEVVSHARSNGSVSAPALATAAQQVTAPRRQERPLIYDEIGTPITNEALPFWNRRQEVQDLLTAVSRIKVTLEKAHSTEDPLYGRVSNSVIMELSSVRQHVLEAMPYTICTVCQGNPSMQPDGCSFCTNKGLITEHQWKVQVLDEVKKLRLKQNAEYAAERDDATR